MNRSIVAFATLLALAGCEQESQPLPFDVSAPGAGQIGSQGGTVSSPAGASVEFAPGSVSGSLDVEVLPTDVPAATSSSGSAISPAFRIEPVGSILSESAVLELKFDADADASRAWLASIVSVVDGEVHEYGSGRVDLTASLARAEVDQLGTFAVVIPEPDAVVTVNSVSSESIHPSLAVLGDGAATSNIAVDCGGPDDRCIGVYASASANLYSKISSAAVLYPAVRGSLDLSGGHATGSIVASASVRVRLRSDHTAENVQLDASFEATPSTFVTETADQIVLSNVRRTVSGSGDESGTVSDVGDLVITKHGGTGTLVISRSFDLEMSEGVTETATVSLEVPVELES